MSGSSPRPLVVTRHRQRVRQRYIERGDPPKELPTKVREAGVPTEVLVWYDSGRKRVASQLTQFTLTWWIQAPKHLCSTTEMLTPGTYGGPPTSLNAGYGQPPRERKPFPRDLPVDLRLSEVQVQVTDILAAWYPLVMMLDAGYSGPVTLIGDGLGVTEFMKGEKPLEVLTRGRNLAHELRRTIDGLGFMNLYWVWVPSSDVRFLNNNQSLHALNVSIMKDAISRNAGTGGSARDE